ncbi:4-hydroxybenzoate octaprenyltransferase [Commensalibacter oyaizuii]|uniref:4-hydroxybenzoate octaprenyltransferase n=1 Tax=Commensalibacter oyaizuii TaxID=3043873 RepID=A0ABT6Q2D5_9PROT|nr:4-hydroxybenzoate octaprenyltransferase [Commensalibacter sp. TBRC 16381]MDI2091253.1 4-hydroxybenzoate octaprenyltransferase [Commensalibacter sp. TBRC 16381]
MNQFSPHSDINLSSWIRYLPASLQPYALLCRIDRPIGTWLLFIPGIWGILLPHHTPILIRIKLIILFGIGSIVMRSAGCVINDIWDRDFDRQVARTQHRPLASGAISLKQAIFFLFILLMIGLGILIQLNPLSWVLGASSLILVALYPGAKRVTWFPQLVLGFTFGFGAPLGYAAAAGHLSWSQAALYAATIFWQIGFDTIYGYQDIEDDQRVGVKSTARWAGDKGKLFVSINYGLCILFLVIASIVNHNHWICIIALGLPTIHFIWQMAKFDLHNPKICLTLFKSNRDAGLLIALALLIGNIIS